jgi:hypothetical protein
MQCSAWPPRRFKFRETITWHDNQKIVTSPKKGPDLHPSPGIRAPRGINPLTSQGNRAQSEKTRCTLPRGYCWGQTPPLGTPWGPSTTPLRLPATHAGEMPGAENVIGQHLIKCTTFHPGEETAMAQSADAGPCLEIGLLFSPRWKGWLGMEGLSSPVNGQVPISHWRDGRCSWDQCGNGASYSLRQIDTGNLSSCVAGFRQWKELPHSHAADIFCLPGARSVG